MAIRVFDPTVFQATVFQVGDAAPAPAVVSSFGAIEAAHAVHTRPLQRKLPRHIQRLLLRDIERQQREERERQRLMRFTSAVLSGARTINSSAGLSRQPRR